MVNTGPRMGQLCTLPANPSLVFSKNLNVDCLSAYSGPGFCLHSLTSTLKGGISLRPIFQIVELRLQEFK